MAEAKLELFDSDLQEMAQMYKALGHPARLQIMHFLASAKTCFSGNIADEIPLSRTTVNQHLNELKKAGLIQGIVNGAKTNYCINIKSVRRLEAMGAVFFNEFDKLECVNCG